MKKFFLSALAILFVSAPSFSQTSTAVKSDQLHVNASKFLKEYFPSDKTISSEVEHSGLEVKSFEVKLSSGVECTFNRDGDWVEVDGKRAIPSGFYPSSIDKYVSENGGGNKIIKIEKEHGGYDVSLTGDIEMHFSQEGKFVTYTD